MTSPLISMRRISKTYYKRKPPLKESPKRVSFDFREGEIVNGAGKKTLSSILDTLYPPTSEEILWQGKSLTFLLGSHGIHKLKKRIDCL